MIQNKDVVSLYKLNHFCPIYKEHKDLSMTELIELYKLPYRSKMYNI
jgi:hypothetical protein